MFAHLLSKRGGWERRVLCGLIFFLILVPFGFAAAASGGNSVPSTSVFGQFMGSILLNLASAVTWFGGVLLEKSIQEFILNIGHYIGKEAGLSLVINKMWGLIRDLCNLAFIFGFIYIGIRTIIFADDSNAKRMLASLIIGAVLINFSLYFTKVVIDVSNYTAVEIYNAVFKSSSSDASLSSKFAEQLGILDFYDKRNNPQGDVLAGMTTGGAFAFYFMAAILLIVAGFVFASGAILILTRFVVLIFIMVFSPILFAATIFPGTAGYAKLLWKQLLNSAFFAPAYLILLLVTVQIIGGAMTTLNPSSRGMASVLSKGETDAFGVILIFIIGIMFLTFSLKAAQWFAFAGADKAMGLAHTIRNRGQAMIGASTLGLAGAGMRTTLGRAGYAAADSDGLKDAAAKRGFRGVAARQILKGSRAVADASFDARNVGAVKKLGLGEGRKGGYETAKKEVLEKESKFAKSLGEVGDDDVRVTARKKEWEYAQKMEKAEVQGLRSQLREMKDKKEEYTEGMTEEQKREVDKRNNETTEKRLKIQDQIDALEKATKDAQTDYEKEKQRRIIGSTFSPETAAIKDKKGEIKEQKDKIKKLWKGYVEMKKEERTEKVREDIKKEIDALEKEEKALYALHNKQEDRGYAGKLEDPSKLRFLTAWPAGRSVRDERKVGKDIRKAAEKGLPKKKDE